LLAGVPIDAEMKDTPRIILRWLRFAPICAILPVFLLLAPEALGQYLVDSSQDATDSNVGDGVCQTATGDCTLRAALQEAEAAGVAATITLPEGTYNWVLGQLLIDQGDITVNGAGARTTIVDAAGNSRFFELDGDSTLVTFRDMEFRNGLGSNHPGGAIETDADLLTLERTVFRNCITEDAFGGAIHNREDIEVYASLFIDCKAFGNDGANGGGGGGGSLAGGGAICSWSTTTSTVLENCTFVGCVAEGGQGGNAQGGGGGGNGGDGIGSFGGGGDGGDVSSNQNNADASAAGFGGGGGGGGTYTGGLWGGGPSGGDATIGLGLGGDGGDGTATFPGSGGGGGAIGGALFMRSGTATVRHCTFSGNSAIGGLAGTGGQEGEPGEGRGGGIGCYGGELSLDNTILYDNPGGTAGGNEDLYHFLGTEVVATVGHNIIGVVDADIVFNAAVVGNQIGVDPVLLPFGDYGGPTDAFLIRGCYSVSPAINSGGDAGVEFDQRGLPRLGTPDIGAIELSALDSVTFSPCAGCTFNGALNFIPFAVYDDGSCLIEGCQDSLALNYLPGANVPAPCLHPPPGCVWSELLQDWDCGCPSDIDGDGLVNVPDLLILLGEFAGGCAD
jgi:hypothetical protein